MLKNRYLLSLCSALHMLSSSFSLNAEENPMQGEIKHLVILMLENRSFDNVLGWLYNKNEKPAYFIPSDTDPHYKGLTKETAEQYTNVLKDSSGQVVFTCPPIKGTPSTDGGKYLDSPKYDPHEPFPHVIPQIFGFDGSPVPTMCGFLQDYASLWLESEWVSRKTDICAIMEGYTEKELPVMCGLAKSYGVSDLWFCSVPTQTNPNRAFSLCGTSEGVIVNGAFQQNTFYADTIWNRLYEESPETTWTIFWQANMVPGIVKGPYSGTNTFYALNRIPHVEDHFKRVDSFHELARLGQLPDISFVEPEWTLCANIDIREKSMEPGLIPRELFVGVEGNDFHPPGDVRGGENLLANIYASLTANKEAWDQTLWIILFDEHGGIFDHVPPPAAIPPDDCFQNGFKFDRYGVRIPVIFVSPKIQKGTVIRSADPLIPFDHTSLIATILKWKNVDKSRWNMGKRVEAAPTFEAIINCLKPRDDEKLLPKKSVPFSIKENNVLHMGDKFYLKNRQGQYVSKTNWGFWQQAKVGSKEDRVTLEFTNGSGKITHGSFCLIQSNDSILKEANVLEVSPLLFDCHYSKNDHVPAQWWTIKSVDHPYPGTEIQFGDKVYLECQVYADPFQNVPGRLTIGDNLFNHFLITSPITHPKSASFYWTIEKP